MNGVVMHKGQTDTHTFVFICIDDFQRLLFVYLAGDYTPNFVDECEFATELLTIKIFALTWET